MRGQESRGTEQGLLVTEQVEGSPGEKRSACFWKKRDLGWKAYPPHPPKSQTQPTNPQLHTHGNLGTWMPKKEMLPKGISEME